MLASTLNDSGSRRGKRNFAPGFVLLLAVLCTVALFPGSVRGEDVGTHVDPDGTLHIVKLTVPPSNLWSPEYKQWYLDAIARTSASHSAPPTPSKDAPEAEWDKFNASQDMEFAPVITELKKRYPVTVLDTQLAGVRVGVVTPRDGVSAENIHRVLINLHGGGFVYFRGLGFGQLESIPVASMGKIKVITVDYRQAPQYRYPAASEDVERVYRELLKQYKPQSIGIYGCSAGGALTAQAVAWFHSKKLPNPGAIGIFCYAPPTTGRLWDLGGDSRIWATNEVIPKNPLSEADKTALNPLQWYMEGANADDATAFPGHSDAVLGEFPPTLLVSGTRSYEMSPVIVAHARFLKLGVSSSLYLIEGGSHAAYISASDTPEARDATAYIAQWFHDHLAQ